jgi:hypothetical protein
VGLDRDQLTSYPGIGVSVNVLQVGGLATQSRAVVVDDCQIDFLLRFMNMVLSLLRIPYSVGVVNRIYGL